MARDFAWRGGGGGGVKNASVFWRLFPVNLSTEVPVRGTLRRRVTAADAFGFCGALTISAALMSGEVLATGSVRGFR